MPVVFRHHGYRFFLYSNEGAPREPPHVHVEKAESEATVWVEPDVGLAYNDGFNPRDLRELLALVDENRAKVPRAWHGYFG